MNEKEFKKQIAEHLKTNGFKIIDLRPDIVDLLIEKDNKKISVGISMQQELLKAVSRLLASKVLHRTNELWLILNQPVSDPAYAGVIKENGIKVFVFAENSLTETGAEPQKNRTAKRGIDYKKLSAIWNVLAAASDWLHVAEIARRTKIKEPTVRWYLDNYLKNAIEEERIVPQIKLRLVKLKQGIELNSYLKAFELIKQVKSNKSNH